MIRLVTYYALLSISGSYRRDSVEPYSVIHCTLTDQSDNNTVSMTEHSIYPSHIEKIIKVGLFTELLYLS